MKSFHVKNLFGLKKINSYSAIVKGNVKTVSFANMPIAAVTAAAI